MSVELIITLCLINSDIIGIASTDILYVWKKVVNLAVILGISVFIASCSSANSEELPDSERVDLTTQEPSAPTSPMGYELNTANETITYPLADYLTYEVVSYVNDTTAHTGIDILAPEGTEVISIGDGTVRTVGLKNFYGYRILVDYVIDDALISITYGHLDSNSTIKAGDQVFEGEVIGKVGSVSNSKDYSRARLHFGVQQNYADLDPQIWLVNHITN